jgi:phage baseplate assembly protein V
VNIFQRVVELERKIAEQERRNRNRRRTGVISEVDTKKGIARVKFSDKPREYKSGWLPWLEIAAGGTSSHIPPIVGEQVDVVSESGDLTDAVIDFSTHSDKNPRPHDGPEMVIKRKDGTTRITYADDKVTIETGEFVVKANKIVLEGDCYVGGEDGALPASREGTVDSCGCADASNFATKVKLK